MSVNRNPFYVSASGSNGAGAITTAGTQAGDIVTCVLQGGTTVPAADIFERIVSVAGQIQQNSSSNLSGNTYIWLVFPQGWKSIQ